MAWTSYARSSINSDRGKASPDFPCSTDAVLEGPHFHRAGFTLLGLFGCALPVAVWDHNHTESMEYTPKH